MSLLRAAGVCGSGQAEREGDAPQGNSGAEHQAWRDLHGWDTQSTLQSRTDPPLPLFTSSSEGSKSLKERGFSTVQLKHMNYFYFPPEYDSLSRFGWLLVVEVAVAVGSFSQKSLESAFAKSLESQNHGLVWVGKDP